MRPSLLVNSLTRYPVKKTSETITLRGLFCFLTKHRPCCIILLVLTLALTANGVEER